MPSSERFYVGFVQADGAPPVWLTSDQTESGVAAKIEVGGDDAFDGADYGMTITPASNGAIHSQAVELNFAGVEFDFKILFCPSALLSALRSAIAPTRFSSATVRVRLVSVKRTIDVYAKANGNAWISTGSFSGSMVRDVTLRLVSTAPAGL